MAESEAHKHLVTMLMLGNMFEDQMRGVLYPCIVASGKPGDPFPVVANGDTLETEPDGSWRVVRGGDDG